MKTFGLLPIDERVSKMSFIQWMWCYYHIVEDEIEEQDTLKIHLDRLAYINNPEVAIKVFEEENLLKTKNNKTNGSSKYKARNLIEDDSFELEMKAAQLGYDPSSGLTPQEYLRNLETKQTKDNDILNDSFDSLLESGEFYEVPDTARGAGNPNESEEEFLDRAFAMLQKIEQEEIQQNNQQESKESSDEDNRTEEEKIRKYLEENGMTEDDLDIIEFSDDIE